MNNFQKINEYVPDYLVAPGEVLEEYLEYAGISQSLFAKQIGLSEKIIDGIIKAKTAIKVETALRFECSLGRPAHFWLNLEQQYQEEKVRLGVDTAV